MVELIACLPQQQTEIEIVQKRIVILGAKPGPIIPRGDAIYCANAAFLSAPDEVSGFPQRTIVASSTVLAKGLPSAREAPAIYRTKVDAIRDFRSTDLVLFEDPGRGDKLPVIREYVSAGQPERKERLFSVEQRTALTRDWLGTYPLVNAAFRMQPLSVQWRDALEWGKWWVSWQLGSRRRDVRAKYRPSTGILALLVALQDHGYSAEYVLAAIGLTDRQTYLIDGNGVVGSKRRRANVLPMHTVADCIALQRLADRVNLSTTEPELYELVRPFD